MNYKSVLGGIIRVHTHKKTKQNKKRTAKEGGLLPVEYQLVNVKGVLKMENYPFESSK